MKRNSNENRIHFPPRTFAAGHRGFTAIWTCNPREELRTILSISPRPSQEFTWPFRNPAPGSENSPRNSPCLWDIYACWKNGTVVFVSYTGNTGHKGARWWSVLALDARARNPSRTQGCNDPFTFIRRYLPSTFLFHHDHKFRCRAIEVYLAARKGRLHLCPCFQPLSLSPHILFHPSLLPLDSPLFPRSRRSAQGHSSLLSLIQLRMLIRRWLNYENSCALDSLYFYNFEMRRMF